MTDARASAYERQYRTVIAPPSKAWSPNDSRRILSLHSRANEDAAWATPFEDHLTSKPVRSDRPLLKRIVKMLQMVARMGMNYYSGQKQRARDVGDGLWELKPKNHRILMFEDRSARDCTKPAWLIVDSFKKPPKSTQSRYIDEAKDTMTDYFRWKEATGV
jgi:hypothetical protein